MQYRGLGNTGLKVSAIGLGCAQLGSSSPDHAVRVVHRALDLGVNYFDTARGYWDSEVKLGLALEGRRAEAIVSTKTGESAREDAWRQVNESLERLRTDYVDNCHLHYLRDVADLDRRMRPDGALAALIQAKEQGLVRHIGCTSHLATVLVEAVRRFPFETILVPMNVVEREPLATLIPLCHEWGIGVTIMKPVATGLLPAPLALKWLLNQPIATAVPGATTVEEVEGNSLVGHRDATLTPAELREVEALRASFERVRCRVCDACTPCPKGVEISQILGSDVLYDHYRTMGREAFRAFPWSRAAAERGLAERAQYIPAIEACDGCGECEAKCPYGLPIVEMLRATLPAMRDLAAIYGELLPTLGQAGDSVGGQT
jgi:aryl-alcohol dehydrogenase-like predicted oxidoreductase